MSGTLRRIITAADPDTRNRPLDDACAGRSTAELLAEAADLEACRQQADTAESTCVAGCIDNGNAMMRVNAEYSSVARQKLCVGGTSTIDCRHTIRGPT